MNKPVCQIVKDAMGKKNKAEQDQSQGKRVLTSFGIIKEDLIDKEIFEKQ